MVKYNTHPALVFAPVHISIHQEIHGTIVLHGQYLYIMSVVTASYPVVWIASEWKYTYCLFIIIIITPQISACFKRHIIGLWTLHGPYLVVIGDSKKNLFAWKWLRTSVKFFIRIALIIHQVDSLFIPLHGEIILCIYQWTCSVLLINGNLIPNLDLSHDAVKLLKCHLGLTHQLHIQAIPGQMTETGPDGNMPQGAVILCVIGFQIGHQVPCLIIIQALPGKLLSHPDHIRSIGVIRPHDSGVIMYFLFPCSHCDWQKISFIPGQQVLNRQHCTDTSVPAVPLFHLSPLHQPVQSKIPHFVTDACNGIAILLNPDMQPTVFRQHRDAFPGRLIPHLLHVSVQAIDFLTAQLCINHWQRRFFHRCIYSWFFFHCVSGTDEIYNQCPYEYQEQNPCFLQYFFHMWFLSFILVALYHFYFI